MNGLRTVGTKIDQRKPDNIKKQMDFENWIRSDESPCMTKKERLNWPPKCQDLDCRMREIGKMKCFELSCPRRGIRHAQEESCQPSNNQHVSLKHGGVGVLLPLVACHLVLTYLLALPVLLPT
jgi:hypothetical protein